MRLWPAMLAAALAVVVAASLAPAQAFAAVAAGSSAGLVTQAAKVKVWVLSKATFTGETYARDDGQTFSSPANATWRFSYNSNGQLTKEKCGSMSLAFKYKGDRLASYAYNTTATRGWLTYDGEGRLSGIEGAMPAGTSTTTYSYNKKGRVTGKRYVDRDGGGSVREATSYSYRLNAAGHIAKASGYSDSGESMGYAVKYDKKGNVAYRGGAHVQPLEVAWTYEGGRATRRVSSQRDESGAVVRTYTLSYKQVSVPKKYVSHVKKQQWELINVTDENYYVPVAFFR